MIVSGRILLSRLIILFKFLPAAVATLNQLSPTHLEL